MSVLRLSGEAPRLALLLPLAGLLLVAARPPAVAGLALDQVCQRSRLILLQGLATQYSDGPPYFADILSAVNGQVPYAGSVYFSYNPDNPQSYSVQDSLQPASRSVEALHRMIAREISQCAGVTIDLVGHSMGGYVALRYLATYGTGPEGAHVRHLITLDSPLNGISSDAINSLAQQASLFGLDISSTVSSPAVRDLIAAYNNPSTLSQNASLARSLSGNVVIGTFGSDDDLISTYANSVISGYQNEYSLGTVSSLCPQYVDACVGHNQILHDPGVLAQIVSLLRKNAGTGAPQPLQPQQPQQPLQPQPPPPSTGTSCFDLFGLQVCISP